MLITKILNLNRKHELATLNIVACMNQSVSMQVEHFHLSVCVPLLHACLLRITTIMFLHNSAVLLFNEIWRKVLPHIFDWDSYL